MKIFRFIFFLFISFQFGCNYTKLKQSNDTQNTQFSLPQEKLSELSYSLVTQKIFTPKCISCHGSAGHINLESYSEVVRNISAIKKVVFDERTMPKRGTLNEEELSYLWNWINLGTPEQAQNGNISPEPEPILATFESINKNIFQISCKECHNPSGSGKRVLLDKESILNSPLELVIPGNADESGLVLSLERVDDKRMPPAKEGYSAIKDSAKAAVRKWIENGAKD